MAEAIKNLQPKNKPQKIQPLAPQETVNQLIQFALEKNQPIEAIQALLDMRRQLKEEWVKEEFFKALSAFQAEVPKIKKNKIVYNKDGKTIRYRYATLDRIIETIKPYLQKHGFSYYFKTSFDSNAVIVTCVVSHRAGHSEEITFRAPVGNSGHMLPIQEWGSALTYAKRYSLCLALGITADEDTDGVTPSDEDNKPPKPSRNGRTVFITESQLKKIQTLFSKLKITDRDMRLAVVRDIVGRDIQTSKDLTKKEASVVIEELNKELQGKQKKEASKEEPIAPYWFIKKAEEYRQVLGEDTLRRVYEVRGFKSIEDIPPERAEEILTIWEKFKKAKENQPPQEGGLFDGKEG